MLARRRASTFLALTFVGTIVTPLSYLGRSSGRAVRRMAASIVSESTLPSPPTRVIVIAGPTAVGKSALALSLCKLLNGELISADSVQVYKGLDIGSNKPSQAERAAVVHHLLDVVEPNEERFTAGRFVRECDAVVDQVAARGKVPIVCGGTPLYLQWLVHGVPDAPASDPLIAAKAAHVLLPFEAAGDWASGVKVLRDLGQSDKADALSENDWYRLSRALEITLIAQAEKEQDQGKETRQQLEEDEDDRAAKYDFRCFFLSPMDRRTLFERIDERCEAMLVGAPANSEGTGGSAGLLEETSSLLALNRLGPDSLAARAIGYRQAIDYLLRPPPPPSSSTSNSSAAASAAAKNALPLGEERGPASVATSVGCDEGEGDEATFLSFVAKFGTATRNYATQQLKWFRKDSAFFFVRVPVSASQWTPLPPPPLSKTKLKKLREHEKREEREELKCRLEASKKKKKKKQQEELLGALQLKGSEETEEAQFDVKRPRTLDTAATSGWEGAAEARTEGAEAEGASAAGAKADAKTDAKALVLELWEASREDFDRALAATEQQAIRDELTLQASKKMRTYATQLKLLAHGRPRLERQAHALQRLQPPQPQGAGLAPVSSTEPTSSSSSASAMSALSAAVAVADACTANVRSVVGLTRTEAQSAQGLSRLLPPPPTSPPSPP
mmetsp:Transcript_44262/g.87125  ORF Transcript_44262/g.87125 Transcript_44262/m.87125 type:complete len:674 (+) Transcript_44262:25-2046(+)